MRAMVEWLVPILAASSLCVSPSFARSFATREPYTFPPVVTDPRDGLNLGAELPPSGSMGEGEFDSLTDSERVLRLRDMPRFFSLMIRLSTLPEETRLRNFAGSGWSYDYFEPRTTGQFL
jgi:hypothetical protein